jgi:hypothetical protein
MSDNTLARVAARTAAEVAKTAELDEEAHLLLSDTQTPHEFLNLLLEQRRWPDACRFLAQALPKREAVWWAYQCVLQLANPPEQSPAALALQVVEKWLAQPTEEHRQPAMAAAEAAGIGTPAGATAVAVAFSGGSMSEPDLPPVPPPDHLTGSVAATVVIMSANLLDPVAVDDAYRKLLAVGIDVASGNISPPGSLPRQPSPSGTPAAAKPAR